MGKKRIDGELLQAIGNRGENLVVLAITDYSQFPKPLFRTAPFTGGWPAVDYVVELTGVRNLTPVLFVQVKSTRNPISNGRIEIVLTPKKKRMLARIPGPTYIIGVQEPTRRVFIRAVFERDGPGVYAIPVTYELTPANLQVLYDEVKEFWHSHLRKPRQSHFS